VGRTGGEKEIAQSKGRGRSNAAKVNTVKELRRLINGRFSVLIRLLFRDLRFRESGLF
jgi:hypothetical protein